jgi:EAL domain-containing protein (putative c-di-GMP-specific phosphodiesterase class I)
MRAFIETCLADLARGRGDPLLLVAVTAAALLAAQAVAGLAGSLAAAAAALAATMVPRLCAALPVPEGGRPAALCLFVRLDAATAGRVPEPVLQALTDRLERNCRRGDRLQRHGATSFALLAAAGSDVEQAVQFAFRLQGLCARPIHHGGAQMELMPAIGFARAEQADGGSEGELIAMAEAAAVAALTAGPGAIRGWTTALRQEQKRRDSAAAALVGAFDRGEIRPWVQPQLSTDTGEITGVEVLARWEHSERGLVPPGEFLPAIAEHELHRRLTDTMLEAALLAWRDWHAAGLQVPRISLNLAPEDLADPQLATRVAWALDRLDIPPDRLGLEVLETVVCTDSDDLAAANLRALSNLGCFIDLDDFGTGHTSIATIRALPIRRLKIDRSFVAGIDGDRDRQQMLAAILTMAEQLGLETLGEGVETSQEHAMLAQLGCDHVQGYWLARPMPAAALHDWGERHRAALPPAALAPASGALRPPVSRPGQTA